jgi:hypothetical protein
MKVITTRGLVEIEELEVKDIVTYEGTARIVATEYRLDSELVKRSVWVDILDGVALNSEQETL